LLLTLGGCSTTADKIDKFDLASRGYEKALRWSKYDMAYSYYKTDSSEQLSVPEYMSNIRLTKYIVANRIFDEISMTTKQAVIIHYYNTNDLRERKLEDMQEWKYFEDLKRWYLVSKPPEFK